MLKTIRLSNLALKAFRADDNEIVGDGGSRANETVKNLSKNLTCVPNIRAIRELNFLTSNAKKAFNYLRLTFIEAPIFRHFDLKSYIQIKTIASGYVIGRVLNQLNLNSNIPFNNQNDLNSNKSDFG